MSVRASRHFKKRTFFLDGSVLIILRRIYVSRFASGTKDSVERTVLSWARRRRRHSFLLWRFAHHRSSCPGIATRDAADCRQGSRFARESLFIVMVFFSSEPDFERPLLGCEGIRLLCSRVLQARGLVHLPSKGPRPCWRCRIIRPSE